MTALLTPAEAMARACPIGRTFASSHHLCIGDACILWRWHKPTTAHPAWAPAVRKVAEGLGEKPPFPKAARIVADDPAAHGMPLGLGRCGLGGKPE